jgi:hypothetical protein
MAVAPLEANRAVKKEQAIMKHDSKKFPRTTKNGHPTFMLRSRHCSYMFWN